MAGIALGSFNDSFSVTSLKAYLAEFISTLLFVFAGAGSAVAYNKVTADAALDPSGLVAVALCNGLAVFVAISVAFNISGGHLNPALTFGLALGGQITVITGIFYCVAQLVGAIVGSYMLVYVTGGLAVPTHGLAAGVGAMEGLVMEIIITFSLVYTVYATVVDPKKGTLGDIAPLTVGLLVVANILAAGPFSGGSMNPARSFGPAVVSGNFADNWIYWVGPLVGGGLGGLVYTYAYLSSEHAPLHSEC